MSGPRDDDTPVESPLAKQFDGGNGHGTDELNYRLLFEEVRSIRSRQNEADRKLDMLADLMRSGIEHIEGVRDEMRQRLAAATDSLLAAIQERRP